MSDQKRVYQMGEDQARVLTIGSEFVDSGLIMRVIQKGEPYEWAGRHEVDVEAVVVLPGHLHKRIEACRESSSAILQCSDQTDQQHAPTATRTRTYTSSLKNFSRHPLKKRIRAPRRKSDYVRNACR